jgi:hypothetical protein
MSDVPRTNLDRSRPHPSGKSVYNEGRPRCEIAAFRSWVRSQNRRKGGREITHLGDGERWN